jgi:hypothetical protein
MLRSLDTDSVAKPSEILQVSLSCLVTVISSFALVYSSLWGALKQPDLLLRELWNGHFLERELRLYYKIKLERKIICCQDLECDYRGGLDW